MYNRIIYAPPDDATPCTRSDIPYIICGYTLNPGRDFIPPGCTTLLISAPAPGTFFLIGHAVYKKIICIIAVLFSIKTIYNIQIILFMKKSFIIIASSLLLAGGLFTSCNKQYTCVCTYTELGIEKINESQTVKASQKDAKDICERTTAIDGNESTCKLK
ncbi:MAG: hypothetical protein BGO09_13195 [Bacteroidetes bacterium 47-18]|nr:MAG: hypothetical protein BGO09_13195 [Bacteroidetes bacterium 47-18]